MDNQTKNSLILEIEDAFSGVRLGEGVSWREALVIDDYGSDEERKTARSQDEKEDWKKVPLELIGDLRYQSSLSFLDGAGLKYYLPICMIYVLEKGDTSDSAIDASLLHTLTNEEIAIELIDHLTDQQQACVRSFLFWHIDSMWYSERREAMRKFAEKYWSGE